MRTFSFFQSIQSTRLATLSFMILTLCFLSEKAQAFGIFISEQGIMKGAQSRVLITPLLDGINLVIQGHYEERAEKLLWLIPVPNIANIEQYPVQANVIDSAILDELSEMTKPKFEGSCDGNPNGEVADGEQKFAGGMGSPMPYQVFPLPPTTSGGGEVNEYVAQISSYFSSKNIQLPMALNDLFTWALDQNVMFVIVELTAQGIAQNPKDITLELTLKAPTTLDAKLYLKAFAYSALGSMQSDIVYWILDQDRFKSANFATIEADFSQVQFTAADQSNYLQTLDIQAFPSQSQKFFVEYAGEINPATLQSPKLIELRAEKNATYLTRLRTRFTTTALKTTASMLNFIPNDTQVPYSRSHRIQGFNCQSEEPDLGMMDQMLVVEAPDQSATDQSVMDQALENNQNMDFTLLFDDQMMAQSKASQSSGGGCHQSRYDHFHFESISLFVMILLGFYWVYRKFL